jgi:hypothetical protein
MNRPAAIVAGIVVAIGISVPRVWPDGGTATAIGLAVAGATAIAVVMVVIRMRSQTRTGAAAERRIRMDGLVGRATVLDLRYTGQRRGVEREAELRLEVLLPRRRRFTVERRDWFDLEAQKRVGIGQSIPIAADPATPGHVVLALDMDDVRSIAGLGPFAGGRGGPKSRQAADPDRPRPDGGQ